MNRFAVILAGGGGTRFWPLSRQNAPKQLLNLSGNDIMINDTIARLEGVIPLDRTYIVTGKNQAQPLKQLVLKDIPKENILLEPVGRNTAPCILYAAMKIRKNFGEGVMCVLPSDHYIENVDEMRRILEISMNLAAERDCLITIGIKPTYAATGYGYIRYSKALTGELPYKVDDFVEKPNFKVAQEYIKSGEYLWNSGMFVWEVSTIIENFKRFLPKIYDKIEEIIEAEGNHSGAGRESNPVMDLLYPQIQSISIDYGILERADNVLVVPGDFGWNDVGSWDALGAIFKPDSAGNIIKAEHIGIDTRNCIIYGSDKLISTIGLEELIVVSTEDALLICPKSRAQEVKNIVGKLKENEKHDLL